MSGGLAVLGAGSSIMSGYEQIRAGKLREDQLGRQKAEEKTAETKRSIDRLDKLRSITSSNAARAGASGINPGSSSFKAVNEKSFNKFDEDENADLLNLKNRQETLTEQQQLAIEQSYISAFGSMTSLGTNFFSQGKSGSK